MSDGYRYRFKLPPHVVHMLQMFDKTKGKSAIGMKAFSFRLTDGIAKPVHIRGPMPNGKAKHSKRKTTTSVAWSRSQRRYHGVKAVVIKTSKKPKTPKKP